MRNYFISFLFILCLVKVKAQPATPFLRIEDGMHTGPIRSISTNAAGNMLLTCSDDKTARLWDAANGQLLNILRIPVADNNEGKLYACALTPDGSIAALGGQTGYEWDPTFCAYILDTQTGKIIHRITGLPGGVWDLKFSKDGSKLAVALSAGGVTIYNVAGWTLAKTLSDYTTAVKSMAFDKYGNLCTASYGKITLYSNRFEKIAENKNLVGKYPGCLVFDPIDRLIAIGYDDVPGIEVRNADDLKVVFRPSINIKIGANANYRPFKLAFSADGSRLYGGGSYQELDKKNTWKYIIRQWSDKGNGVYLNLDVMQETVDGFEPLPNGRLAVIGAFPEICVLSAKGELIWGHSAPKNMYNYELKDNPALKVDKTASDIGFTPYLQNALSFNVISRQLSKIQSIYPGPGRSHGGTSVTFSKSHIPIINLHEVHLDSAETVNGIDVSDDGKQVIFTSNFHLYKFDAEGKFGWKANLTANAFAVNISGNGKAVVTELGDGTIRWFSMESGKELLAFYLSSAQRESNRRLWVLFTPSGYYDASAGAEDILGWLINKGPDTAPSFYPASSFRDQYYRPDIIDAIFKTYNEDEAVELANSKSKRPAHTAFNITEKLPPQILIKTPVNGSTANSESVTIKYSVITPLNAPVTRLRILINGRPTGFEVGQRGVTLLPSKDYTVNVNIPAANCTITLIGDNDYGASPAANLILRYATKTTAENGVQLKPSLFVLAIGISDYKSDDLKLRYAAADAQAFATAMARLKGNSYENVSVKKLVDSAATKDNIYDAFEWVQNNTTRQDVAMIFFAGHGISDQTGHFFMLPYGANIEKLRKTCINSTELQQTVSNILGKVIVFIDACNSGRAFGAGGLKDVADMDGVVNQITSPTNGAFAFTSCLARESAFESSDWQHGAFTKALLEGLVDGACLNSDDKEIRPIDLAAYIDRRVRKLTGDKQHSTFNSPANSENFSIAKL